MIVIGIGLEVLAACFGTASKQLIAYSSYVDKRWIFHLGAFINVVVGPLLDASAYGFAPQTVVAPFACLDVIFNMLVAPCTLSWQREHIGRYHIGGTFLVAVGAVLTAVFGGSEAQNLTGDELSHRLLLPRSLAYLITEGGCLLLVGAAVKWRLMPPRWRGIGLGCLAGVLMGNVFFLKGLIGILGHAMGSGDWTVFLTVTPWICLGAALVGAVVGHLVMRRGLAEYKGVYMVTIFEGAHITAACLSGCIVMGEMSSSPWTTWCAYWAAVSLIILGILLVNIASGARLGSFTPHDSVVGESLAASFMPPRLNSRMTLNSEPLNGSERLPNLGTVNDAILPGRSGPSTPNGISVVQSPSLDAAAAAKVSHVGVDGVLAALPDSCGIAGDADGEVSHVGADGVLAALPDSCGIAGDAGGEAAA